VTGYPSTTPVLSVFVRAWVRDRHPAVHHGQHYPANAHPGGL